MIVEMVGVPERGREQSGLLERLMNRPSPGRGTCWNNKRGEGGGEKTILLFGGGRIE